MTGQLTFILFLLTSVFLKSQVQNRTALLKSYSIENPKEKQLFLDTDRPLIIYVDKKDSIVMHDHRPMEIFHKKFIAFDIRNQERHKSFKDSLIKVGFVRQAIPKDISSECEWSTQILKVDKTKQFKDPYKNDTSTYYKAEIRLLFKYSPKKKAEQFTFVGYIRAFGHNENLKDDNTCNNTSIKGCSIIYYQDANIYEFTFPYRNLYEYWSDFYNADLKLYF